MSSIVKENEVLTVSPEAGARSAATAVLPGDTAAKPQPVALEMAVTVHGARTVNGSDKREPFSESTKTVLVFGNGAVIRLSSAVTPGQLLFLTNEKTKKEVVCQVVKSKNYRNVSGYVELEFTEQVIGFWGMRFPGDRIGSQPAPAAATTPPPAAMAPPPISVTTPKMESTQAKPQAPVLQKPVVPAPVPAVTPTTPRPVAPLNLVAASPLAPSSPVSDLPRSADAKPAMIAPKPPDAAAAPPAVPMTPMRRASDIKVLEAMAAPPVAKVEPPAAVKDNSSDALKLEAARLQEQLSSLLFTEAPKPAQNAASIATIGKTEAAETAAKLFEIAKNEPTPLQPPVQAMPPVKSTPATMKSQLELEEVKIPAWLEPLARNVAAPVSTEELIEREKSKHAAALGGISRPVVEPAPLAEPLAEEESTVELAAPTFDNSLAIDENSIEDITRASGSNKVLWIGAIAAAIVLALAGGAWYMRQGASSPQANATAALTTPAPAATTGIPPNPVQPIVAASGAVSPKPAVSAPTNAQPAAILHDVKDNSTIVTPAAVRSAPPLAQPKKSSLGEVRLATPTIKHGASNAAASDAAPAMGAEGIQIAADNAELGGGFMGAGKQPAAPVAPLPVGGDVRPAKMISSVPPMYPTLAKTQHISGDVKVDALIDVNGRVTTMKVVSGPTLLHQSAMDALRQWKYQPATLDGKPVPMHLTITIQFRLQ